MWSNALCDCVLGPLWFLVFQKLWTLKNSICASKFCFRLGKTCTETFKETKWHSSQCKSPSSWHSKVLFQCEVMLIISLDMPRIVRHEFIPQGQSVNNISMQMFYSVHRKTCSENDVRSGTMRIGFLFTTMFLHILLCLYRNLWPVMAWLFSHTLYTLQI